ncbi:MAG: alpha/beta fold hydrolase [Planctomycetota bacterium]
MIAFEPPPFRPHWWVRGGHLQTIASLKRPTQEVPPTTEHVVDVSDGDAIVVHETAPVDGSTSRDESVVLIHGLSGCHQSPYMVRMAIGFAAQGWSVYRVDMRGCGSAFRLACQLSHAGRSADVAAALDFVARRRPSDRLSAAGVSLGGNQLLRLVGRIGAGVESTPTWFERLDRIAVVAPPIDLVRCSENMQRLSRRPYSSYFIRNLFERMPPGVQERGDFRALARHRRPSTLYELDDQWTAPLSGFEGADHYYRESGAAGVCGENPVETLVLAADDDPIVPIACFDRSDWPEKTRVIRMSTGGHVGYIARGRQSWMDRCVAAWLNRL